MKNKLLLDYVEYESNSNFFKIYATNNLLLRLWSNAIGLLGPGLFREDEYKLDCNDLISLARLTFSTVKVLDNHIEIKKYLLKEVPVEDDITKLLIDGLNAIYAEDYNRLVAITVDIMNSENRLFIDLIQTEDSNNYWILNDFTLLMTLESRGTKERNNFILDFLLKAYEKEGNKNIPLESKLQLLDNVLRDEKITISDLLVVK